MRDEVLIEAEKMTLACAEVLSADDSPAGVSELLHEMARAIVIKAHHEGVPYRTLLAEAIRDAEQEIRGIDEEE